EAVVRLLMPSGPLVTESPKKAASIFFAVSRASARARASATEGWESASISLEARVRAATLDGRTISSPVVASDVAISAPSAVQAAEGSLDQTGKCISAALVVTTVAT